VNRPLADWLQTPLSELGDDPRRIADRHEAISLAHGPAIANGAIRTLRAVYNHARKTCRALPAENPVFPVDWNPEERRDTAMGVRDLPERFEQLARIENPVRREFHLLCLLSGSRPEALKMVRLAEIDFRERRPHIPKPKCHWGNDLRQRAAIAAGQATWALGKVAVGGALGAWQPKRRRARLKVLPIRTKAVAIIG